jgi:hypothetical protein
LSIALATVVISQVVFAQDQSPKPTSDKNIVYEMDGEAKIRRSSWDSSADSQPLSVADEVGNNDVVIPVDGTIVTILCADGKLVQVSEMMGPPPCKPIPGTTEEGGLVDLSLNRGAEDVALLITPNGKMLSNKPGFRWASVKNASQYQVILSQNGALVWKKEYIVPSTTLKMDYPKDENPLAAGDYAVKIEALNPAGRALSFDTPVTQITIVSEDESKAVLNSVKTPNGKSTKADMVAYRKARVFANNEFYADAIKTLEDALKISIPDSSGLTYKNDKPNSLRTGALPYILLGNWYSNIHLSNYAGVAYQSALNVAQQFDQPENAAWASVQMAVVLTDLRQKYCGFANASSFFSSVLVQGTLIDQMQQQMTDTVTALGYEPTCAA